MATTIEVKPEAVTLSNDEILRYSRHLIMPEVGMEGQQKLKAARALCIGAGGLGSPLALYLAAAGVGTLGIVDFDVVDYTNLQRQIIHTTADVGRNKLDSAAEKLIDGVPNVDQSRLAEMIYWHAVALVTMNRVDESLPLFKRAFALQPSWKTLTPLPWLPRGARPAPSVPMKLCCTVFRVVPGSASCTPFPRLPEIMFSAPRAPTVFWEAPPSMSTPNQPLGTANVPPGSVPM